MAWKRSSVRFRLAPPVYSVIFRFSDGSPQGRPPSFVQRRLVRVMDKQEMIASTLTEMLGASGPADGA
jgi:hypothetical protein